MFASQEKRTCAKKWRGDGMIAARLYTPAAAALQQVGVFIISK
jgi:hypothetical protein